MPLGAVAEEEDSEHHQLVKAWTEYQIHLAQVAVFDDSNLTFNVHAESRDYAFSQAEVTNPVVKHLNDENAFHGLSIVGGLDISMFSDGKKAVAQLVVLSFPQLEILDSMSSVVDIPEPYIPSFLAMRECRPLVNLLEAYKASHPHHFPQVFLVDGNGRLHERQAGLAVSLGVLANVPTVGIAKEYYPISAPSFGPAADFRSSQKSFKEKSRQLVVKRGDFLPIPDPFGTVALGAALYTSRTERASRAIMVSSGHRVSLNTAMLLALACTAEGRLPVPIKAADNLSRSQVKA